MHTQASCIYFNFAHSLYQHLENEYDQSLGKLEYMDAQLVSLLHHVIYLGVPLCI